jgi:hypothetical protein
MKTPPRRIVIVETSLACAEAVRQSEYHVAAFPSATTAFHAAHAMEVEAFVIRLDDPRDLQSRLDLASRLRVEPTMMDVPVIIATGDSSAATRHAVALGAHVVDVTESCEPVTTILKALLPSRRA